MSQLISLDKLRKIADISYAGKGNKGSGTPENHSESLYLLENWRIFRTVENLPRSYSTTKVPPSAEWKLILKVTKKLKHRKKFH